MGKLSELLGQGGRRPALGTGSAEQTRQALLNRQRRLAEEEEKSTGARKPATGGGDDYPTGPRKKR